LHGGAEVTGNHPIGMMTGLRVEVRLTALDI
jgi:hypothetical protein